MDLPSQVLLAVTRRRLAAQATATLGFVVGLMSMAKSIVARTQIDLPYASMLKTFDYTPARDGLALIVGSLTSGDGLDGAQSHPAEVWTPRFSTTTDPKGGSDTYYGEFQYYVDPEYSWSNHYSPFAIVNGMLRIRAQRTAGLNFLPNEVPNDPITGAPYTFVSGALTTKGSFSQKAGYFEVIALMPKGTAIWPAIWMLPVTGNHPPEIDINEYIGNTPSQYHVNVLTIGDNGIEHSFFCTTSQDLSRAYHAYGMMWTDTAIIFYLDNTPIRAVDISGRFGFSDPFYILLNVAVGSRKPNYVIPGPDATTPSPADMLIKSVRVWQRFGPNKIFFVGAQAVLETAAIGSIVSELHYSGLGSTANGIYSIVGDSDAIFAIVSNQLTTRSALSFAQAPYHTVIIQIADSKDRTWQQPFSIVVLDAGIALNTLLGGSDLTNNAWTKFGLIVANGTTGAPAVPSQIMMETEETSYHGVEQICSKPASSIRYIISADLAPHGRDWVKFEILSSRVTSARAFFNLADGQVGSAFGSGLYSSFGFANCRIVRLRNGFSRCQIDITTNSDLEMHIVWKLALSGSDYAPRPGDPTKGVLAKAFMRAVAIG